MHCISQFSKYVIYVLNFLFGICAIVLIVFGIMDYMNEDAGVNVFSDIGDVFSLGIIAICFGGVIVFVAGFGFCGALHENTFLLTIYGVILMILFALQLALGILTIIKVFDKDGFHDFVKGLLLDLFNDGKAASLEAFHNIQTHFKCCGVNDFNDYNLTVTGYPSSCCENGRTPCFQTFEVGCASAFMDATRGYIQIIGYVAIGFAVVQLLGAMFAFMVRQDNLQNELKFKGPSKEETSI